MTEPRVNQIWIEIFVKGNCKWCCGWIFSCSTLHSVWFYTCRNVECLRSHFNLMHFFIYYILYTLFQNRNLFFGRTFFYAPQNIFSCIVSALQRFKSGFCNVLSEGLMSLNFYVVVYVYRSKVISMNRLNFSQKFWFENMELEKCFDILEFVFMGIFMV